MLQTARPTALAIFADQRHAVSGDFNGVLYLWDLLTGELKQTLTCHRSPINRLTMIHNDQKIVSSAGGSIRIWEWQKGVGKPLYTGHEDNVRALAWFDQNRQAISSGYDQTVKLWNTTTGRVTKTLTGSIEERPIGPVGDITVAHRLFKGEPSADQSPAIWVLEKEAIEKRIVGYEHMEAQGKLPRSRLPTLKRWNPQTAQVEHVIRRDDWLRHTVHVQGKRVISIVRDKDVGIMENPCIAVVWNVYTQTIEARYHSNGRPIRDAVLHHDGCTATLVIKNSWSANEIATWNLETNTIERTIQEASLDYFCINDHYLCYARMKVIKLRELQTGRLVATHELDDTVTALVISTDNAILAGTTQGTVYCFDLTE